MLYEHGVPNYAEVDPGVYRSGQITTQEGWDYIRAEAAGRTVHIIKLNFNSEGGGTDLIASGMGFDVVHLPIQPQGDQSIWDDVRAAYLEPDLARLYDAVEYLRFCHDRPTTDYCLVHCTHGQDRTGTVVGMYRVKVDGWTKMRAYAEMLAHHYHWQLHGLHEFWEGWTP